MWLTCPMNRLFLLKIIPRNFTWLPIGITWPLIDITIRWNLLRRFRLDSRAKPRNITSDVFRSMSKSFHLRKKLASLTMWRFMAHCALLGSYVVQYAEVSSANWMFCMNSSRGMSYKNKLKRIGEITEPCGVPAGIFSSSEMNSFTRQQMFCLTKRTVSSWW